MRIARIVSGVAAVVVVLCATAGATEKEVAPVTVVYNDGQSVALKSVEIGYEEAGLFGTSYKKIRKLPVVAGKLKLDVPMEKLARIEFLAVDEEPENVKVRLTALDGETQEGMIGTEKKIIWKGTHPFADSEVTLNPAEVTEIILVPEKKEEGASS